MNKAEHWGASFLASNSEFKFPSSSILLESLFQFTIALYLKSVVIGLGQFNASLDASFRKSSGATFIHYCTIPDKLYR